MKTSRFLISFAAGVVVLAAVFAAFSWIVDPYLLFDRPRQPGFNAVKPAVETREWMMKAYQAPRVRATTLVLGSSCTDIGLDPGTSNWPPSSQPVYNLSLVGAGVDSNLQYLRHVVALRKDAAPPERLVVGLDFESALLRPPVAAAVPRAAPAEAAAKAPDETAERLAMTAEGLPNPQRRLRVLRDQAEGLLSLDALFDSISTLRANRSTGRPDMEASGRLSEAQLRQWVQADGVAALFDQKNAITLRSLNKPHRVLGDTPNGPIRSLIGVRRLIGFAKDHRLELILSVQPSHAARLELLDHMGYWSDFERWKRELTALVDAERRAGAQVVLWDFGGYDAQMLEVVPAPGDRAARLQWFWDPVHYTAALGDVMVDRMFGKVPTEGFGALLTPATLDARLERVRLDRQRYRDAQPAEIQRVRQLFCRTAGCP